MQISSISYTNPPRFFRNLRAPLPTPNHHPIITTVITPHLVITIATSLISPKTLSFSTAYLAQLLRHHQMKKIISLFLLASHVRKPHHLHNPKLL